MTEKTAPPSFSATVRSFFDRLINGPENRSPGPEPAGNMGTGTLKLIALVFMFIDHSGKVLFDNNPDMRLIGRIAFPIYIWCMIVGFHRTKNPAGYMLRVILTGLISQPLYVLALDYEGHVGKLIQTVIQPLSGGFSWDGLWSVLDRIFLNKPNIFLTLALGLGAIWGIREKKLLSQFWAPVAAIFLATVLKADYGWPGVGLFIVMYAASGSRPGLAAAMVSYFLFWGFYLAPTGHIRSETAFGLYDWVAGLKECKYFTDPVKSFLHASEIFGLLSLPLILYRPERERKMNKWEKFLLVPDLVLLFRRIMRGNWKMPKWLSYALYPGHLVIIILLKIYMFGWS